MAQLTDDCFAFGGPMLTVPDALALIRQRLCAIDGSETVTLRTGLGRILASDVVAPVNVPDFDNSAVDGYAVRHADLAAAGDTVLPVAARLPAGALSVTPIAAGTAVRIFTGAPMPAGADTVFMQEDVRAGERAVVLPAGLKAGANRRFAGEDFRRGAVVAARGARLDPRHLAGLAAVGVTEVTVRRRLKVALLSTGDELVRPGADLVSGQQYDSNSTLLAALLARRGVEVTELGILRDRRDGIRDALADAARDHDLILTSGGVSTGEEDHVKAALEQLGKLNFWRLAIKPGRPVALGQIGGCVFAGLPGNPVASFVTFVRLAGPLIDHLAGGAMILPHVVPVRADFSHRKKAGRTEYLRGSLRRDDAGGLSVSKYPNEGAALISSLIGSDGLVELPEDVTEVTPGRTVSFLPYAFLI